MNIFTKNAGLDPDQISVELLDEPNMYTTGDRVRGQALLSSRSWHQMAVEVLLVCEEHSELNEDDAGDVGYESRRITIAGETVDGEATEDGHGTFPFELRILDDPQKPFLLPSFDVDSGELNLLNCIRWQVEVRVTHKSRVSQITREIVVIPARLEQVVNTQQSSRREIIHRAYERRPQSSFKLGKARVQQFHDALVAAELSLPNGGLSQDGTTVPIKLSLATSHPMLLAVTSIHVRLFQIAEANIRGSKSVFSVYDDIQEPQDDIYILLDENIKNLTANVSNARIENACSSFAGKWLSMRHEIQVKLTIVAAEKKDYRKTLVVSAGTTVYPPRLSGEHLDAPPRYSPPINGSSNPFDVMRNMPFSNRASASDMLDWFGSVERLGANSVHMLSQ